ncbi:hypothetical protein [Motiliproteus sediminis]|uniref:hypothetical protein n=1 Tax=Motiliproteus sediminis TaxID=1468178 RepID=UPI001AEFA63B|nr:hypothetical protein [Motiliproteus sediminis]
MSGATTRSKPCKPSTREAMQRLIDEIRLTLPFDLPQAELCNGPCSGCPKKLLEFIDTELDEWQHRLARGEQPRLGDISRLARRARKIHRVMELNQLL